MSKKIFFFLFISLLSSQFVFGMRKSVECETIELDDEFFRQRDYEQVRNFSKKLKELLDKEGIKYVKIPDVDMKKMKLFCEKMKAFFKKYKLDEKKVFKEYRENEKSLLFSLNDPDELKHIISSVLKDERKIKELCRFCEGVSQVACGCAEFIGCVCCLPALFFLLKFLLRIGKTSFSIIEDMVSEEAFRYIISLSILGVYMACAYVCFYPREPFDPLDVIDFLRSLSDKFFDCSRIRNWWKKSKGKERARLWGQKFQKLKTE